MSQDVTQLLVAWRGGNKEALNNLFPLVYDELRRLAKYYMLATVTNDSSRQEAYLRLINYDPRTLATD